MTNNTISEKIRTTILSLKIIGDFVKRIGNFSDSGETIAHKLENITFDTSDLAKEGDNSGATNTEILNKTNVINGKIGEPNDVITAQTLFGKLNDISLDIPTESKMKNLYSARSEQNDDGEDTYTIVFPYSAQIVEVSGETMIII